MLSRSRTSSLPSATSAPSAPPAGARGDRHPEPDLPDTLGWLVVDFCGDERDLGRSGRLTFGRCAGMTLDDDPYLHRTVGEFVADGAHWWLRALGPRTPLTVRDPAGTVVAVVAPGAVVAVPPGPTTVGFASGPHRYELEVLHERPDPQVPEGDDPHDGADGADPFEERTLEWGRVELNDEQRRLLVALAGPALRGGPDAPLPTNRAVAAALGWTITKLNRKLDHLCLKVARAGVAGLRGDLAGVAADRRRRLVEHALSVGLVSAADLED